MMVCKGAQNGFLCTFYARIRLVNGISISPALAVAGKELVEQNLKRLVLGHDIVLAQVVAASGAGVHLCSERPLETGLGMGEAEREGGGGNNK